MTLGVNREPDSSGNACQLPDSPRSSSGRLIICEPTGRWAVALRRELTSYRELTGDNPVEETRSVAECWERLRNAPASFVVVELTRKNVDTLLKYMVHLEWRFPLARVAVVARRNPADCEWAALYERLTRQAGAVFFGTSLRSEEPHGVRALAGVAFRHLQQSPHPRRTISEEIWATLPWRSFATSVRH